MFIHVSKLPTSGEGFSIGSFVSHRHQTTAALNLFSTNDEESVTTSVPRINEDTSLNRNKINGEYFRSYCRRDFGKSLLGAMAVIPFLIEPGLADDDENVPIVTKGRTLLRGTVNLQNGVVIDEQDILSRSALYVTARPNNPVDVPRAILDGSSGKPPPVLAARIPNARFPLSFELTASDLTIEGSALILGEDNNESYWWEGKDLIVSARFDSDGVAATRDPTDLVGRGLVRSNEEVSIQLQGRGLTGKLFTGKSNK